MESSAENQIYYALYFSRTSLLWAAVIVPSLAFTCFLSPGLSPLLLTFSVLVLSTVSIVTFTKRRVIPNERSVQGENAKQKINAAQPIEVGGVLQENAVETLDSGSESTEPESITSEEFEGQSPATSDCSISDDEDSLIEIALPGQRSAYSKEEPKQKPQSNLPDYLPESILQQQGLEELLAEIHEVNEEENLIEIDISIGSIKCSRFEIEA